MLRMSCSCGKRLPNECNQATFRKNMQTFVSKDQKLAEQITSSVISLIGASPHGTIRVEPHYGQPLPITKSILIITFEF